MHHTHIRIHYVLYSMIYALWTMCDIVCTMYLPYTLCILHYALSNILKITMTMHSTLYILHFQLYRIHHVLFNKTNKYVMCKIHYTAHSIHNKYSILCKKYTMGNTLCTINNEAFTMHNILCTVHYSIYIIQYSLCIKKYRIYTVYWALKQCTRHDGAHSMNYTQYTIY